MKLKLKLKLTFRNGRSERSWCWDGDTEIVSDGPSDVGVGGAQVNRLAALTAVPHLGIVSGLEVCPGLVTLKFESAVADSHGCSAHAGSGWWGSG